MTDTPVREIAHAPAPAVEDGAWRGEWQSRQIGFRYQLSYLKLFEINFTALDDARPFDPDRPAVAELDAPLPEVPAPYDVIAIRHQPLSAPIAVIKRVPTMLRYAPRQLLHFYTDLRRSHGDPFGAMSSKTRSTVLRKVRNYEKFCGGAISWRICRTPEDMRDYQAQARQVAIKTYQERLFDAGLPDDDAFRNHTLELADRDLVRGFLLFHGDRPVAYLYTPAPDGFLVYQYLGYDPAYASHSPGTVLQYLALKALYEEGRFPLYYWGYGFSQTKQIFSTGQFLAADVYFFRPTVRNYVAVWLHYTTDRFSEIVGALLDRVGLKQKINRWLKRT
jgi:GNAT acetyltransferase-like protein